MRDMAIVVGAGFLGMAAVGFGKASTWLYRKQAQILSIAFAKQGYQPAHERAN
jgi:hypothetical protein